VLDVQQRARPRRPEPRPPDLRQPDHLRRRQVQRSIRDRRISISLRCEAVASSILCSAEAVEHGRRLVVQSSGTLAGVAKSDPDWHTASLLLLPGEKATRLLNRYGYPGGDAARALPRPVA
jgi:hypothetical protein